MQSNKDQNEREITREEVILFLYGISNRVFKNSLDVRESVSWINRVFNTKFKEIELSLALKVRT